MTGGARRIGDPRGQANLVAVAVALVLLTAVTGLGLTLADAALAGAERDVGDHRGARAVGDRLVSADAPTTVRQNVLDSAAMASLTAEEVTSLAPPVEDAAIRVALDDAVLVGRGDPTGGATLRRVVLVADETERTRTLDLGDEESLTLPRRTDRVTLTVQPGDGSVTTVRANGRVVLHDPEGLSGTATVSVPRRETITLTVETEGQPDGDLVVTSYPRETTKATLAVTVDA